MTAWFDGVDISVEVAFSSDPLAETPVWTDITRFVRSVDTDTGRTSEYSQYSPSSLSLTLDNNDRRFDPEYADGAYMGTPLLDGGGEILLDGDDEWLTSESTTVNLLPMKRVRVRATYDAVTYPVFDGFILGWPQVVQGMVDETVRVSAVDGFRFLENATLQRSAYEAAVLADSPVGYWPLQEQNAIVTPFEDLVNGTEMRALPLRGATPVVLARPSNDVIGAPFGVAAVPNNWPTPPATFMFGLENTQPTTDPLSVEAWAYVGSASSAMQIAASGSSTTRTVSIECVDGQWTVGASSISLNRYATPAVATAVEVGVWVHLVATIDVSDVKFYVNGQLVYTQATSVGSFVNSVATLITADGVASDAIAHYAVYDTTLTLDQVQAHYFAGITAWGHPYGERSGARIERALDEIGWPDALRDISTGDTVHGQYLPNRQSALAYLRQVAAGEDGLLYIGPDGKVTFRDRSWQWGQATSGTFSDDGAGLPYSDIVVDANTVDAIRNAVAVSFRSGDGYVRVENAASVTAYGPSSDDVNAATVDSSAAARGLANYRLRTRKDPRLLISELEAKPRTSPAAMFPVALGVNIGDVVTVERTPAGVGSQVVKKLAVQGYGHSIGPADWVTRYYLAPAPTSGADAPYLLVNTSGATSLIGAASGNLIPF